jgi:hypothetical protein
MLAKIDKHWSRIALAWFFLAMLSAGFFWMMLALWPAAPTWLLLLTLTPFVSFSLFVVVGVFGIIFGPNKL